MNWCKSKAKTIVVPKGILDPTQTNVLELPTNLDDSNFVVNASNSRKGYLSVEAIRESDLASGAFSDVNAVNCANFVNFGVQTSSAQPQQQQPPPICLPANKSVQTFQQPIHWSPPQSPMTQTYYPQPQVPICTHPPQNLQPSQFYSPTIPAYTPPNRDDCMGTSSLNDNPHSPLCPICAALHNSNKLLDRANGPPNNSSYTFSRMMPRTSSLYPSLLPNCNNLALAPRSQFPPVNCLSNPGFVQMPKSDTSLPLQMTSNNLTKLIEDKIEKTIKPLLSCLTNAFPEKESEYDCCAKASVTRRQRSTYRPACKHSSSDLLCDDQDSECFLPRASTSRDCCPRCNSRSYQSSRRGQDNRNNRVHRDESFTRISIPTYEEFKAGVIDEQGTGRSGRRRLQFQDDRENDNFAFAPSKSTRSSTPYPNSGRLLDDPRLFRNSSPNSGKYNRRPTPGNLNTAEVFNRDNVQAGSLRDGNTIEGVDLNVAQNLIVLPEDGDDGNGPTALGSLSGAGRERSDSNLERSPFLNRPHSSDTATNLHRQSKS